MQQSEMGISVSEHSTGRAHQILSLGETVGFRIEMNSVANEHLKLDKNFKN